MRNYGITVAVSVPNTVNMLKEYCRIMDKAVEHGYDALTENDEILLPILEQELLKQGEPLPKY